MAQSTDYNIRPAILQDVPVILQLVKKLAEYERLSHQATATEELFSKYGFGETTCFQALLAEDSEKKALGFALYFFKFSTFLGKPTLHLEDLFVLPEFRGQGIGKSLLKKLAGIALEKDCGRMEWDVLDWNKPAIEFYESIQAAPLSGWITYRLTGKSLTEFAEKNQENENQTRD
jgi:GNAT superfamily N-acetyltransferase